MRPIVFISSLLLLVATSRPPMAAADDGGLLKRSAPGEPGVASQAMFTLEEAWNDTQAPTVFWTYSAECFGFKYIPSHDYVLTRIEFFAGDVEGPVTVEVRADDGSGVPAGPVLGTVTYQETAPRRWQGADLGPSIEVHAGTTYYIRYQVVVGALTSFADAGALIPHTWSDQCDAWYPVLSPLNAWMARFYGDATTDARPRSWGQLKMLYRPPSR